MKKFICVLLCLLLIVSMFSACGNNNDTDKKDSSSKDKDETTTATSAGGETEGTQGAAGTNTPNKSGPSGTVGAGLEYIRTVRENSIYTPCEKAFIYKDSSNGMCGVANTSGSFDSGAIYHNVDRGEGLFIVQTKKYDDPNNPDCLNCTGVIDENGKVIIPAEYALIKSTGEYYLRAYKVTGVTTDASNYLLRLSKKLFSMNVEEGDVLYTGTWCVYDARTGKLVPGVAGTTSVNLYQNGDVLTFTENGQKVSKNAAGEDMPQDARMFLDGSYIPKGESAVYGPDKQKRFDFTPGDYEPTSWNNGHYIMRKTQGSSVYVVADETGKICSTTFNQNPNILDGGLVGLYEDGVYTMQGKQILDKYCNTVYYSDGYWLMQDTDKNVHLVDSSHQVETIGKVEENDIYTVDRDNFTATKKISDSYDFSFYCIAKKDFLEGNPVDGGLAQRKTGDETKILVEIATDAVLLSGYRSYSVAEDAQGVRYIYAQNYDAEYNVYYDLFIMK